MEAIVKVNNGKIDISSFITEDVKEMSVLFDADSNVMTLTKYNALTPTEILQTKEAIREIKDGTSELIDFETAKLEMKKKYNI